MTGQTYQCFRACVRKAERIPFVEVPKRVSAALGDGFQAGRIHVEGLLNTSPFRTTLIPLAGERHRLFLNPGMRQTADVEVGDMVVVAVRPAEPGVPAPPDMAAGMRKVKGAALAFDALPPSQRGELIRYVEAAKTPEDRRRRIGKVARRVLQKHDPASSKPKVRPLWTCPDCGEQFATQDHLHDHACHRYRIDELFAGKPAAIRRLFDRFRSMVESCGRVKRLVHRDKVLFVVHHRFAGAMPKSRWLDIHFWLPRRVKDPRFRRIDSIYPRAHSHSLRITAPEELDDQVQSWLQQAYEIGCQEDLGE